MKEFNELTFADIAHLYVKGELLTGKITIENDDGVIGKQKGTFQADLKGVLSDGRLVVMPYNHGYLWIEEIFVRADQFIPYFRPMSSMTEQEAIQCASLTEYKDHFRDVKVERNKLTNDLVVTWDGCHESRDMINATGDLFYCAEQILWYLENRFDIFDLIASGKALDIATIPSSTPTVK